MTRVRQWVVCLLAVALLVGLVHAQDGDVDLTETFPIGETDFEVLYPAGFEPNIEDAFASGLLSEVENIDMIIGRLTEIEGFSVDGTTSMEQLMVDAYLVLREQEINLDDVSVIEGEPPGAFYEFGPDHVSFIMKDEELGEIFFADAYTYNEEPFIDAEIDLAFAIFDSVRASEGEEVGDTDNSEVSESSEGNADTEMVVSADCTVTVAEGSEVRLRVLPGPNRQIIKLLEPGTYAVIDRAVGPAGNLWWRLDKSEAAPRSPAEQTWVAAVRVTAAAACRQADTGAATDTADSDGTRVAAVNAGPCTVVIDASVAIPFRVGPGRNRTQLGLLQPGEYNPIARIQLENGAVWFQLDKDAVLPGSSAAEIWMPAGAAPQVTGACRDLPVAEGSEIIAPGS